MAQATHRPPDECHRKPRLVQRESPHRRRQRPLQADRTSDRYLSLIPQSPAVLHHCHRKPRLVHVRPHRRQRRPLQADRTSDRYLAWANTTRPCGPTSMPPKTEAGPTC
jgi:hypothetical protein